MSYDINDLRDLGISSSFQALEFELKLDIRFSEFTPPQREIWRRQTLCLDQYARTRTNSSAAQAAGVSVYTMEAWEQDNELGFNRRKETADREFCDGLDELLLERARMPDSPPSLLTAVLRAQMPEKYGSSRNDRGQDDDHDRTENEPDTYHKLLADIIQVLQEREVSPKAVELSPTSTNDENASHDLHHATAENEETGSGVSAADSLNLSHTDRASARASRKPAPDAITGPRTEDSPAPRSPATVANNPDGLNRRQRRQLQRDAKRKPNKSNLARAPS